MTAADTASFAGFARLLGVKPQAVTALRHAGRLVLTADGKRVDVAASQQRLRDTADPSKAGVVARHAAERAAKAAAAVASAATTLRSSLESLPDVLGPQLAAITDEAQARATLAEAIEHALEECSRQFSNIARQISA